MGLIVLNYSTNEGFLVPQLYLQVNTIRMNKTLEGPNYSMYYGCLAFKSVTDKEQGASPVSIPNALSFVQEVLTANDFYDQTIFGFAYAAIKRVWEAAGFIVEDYYPKPPTPTTYIYDCSGYSFRGFNCAGYDREGYGKDGFNKQGWDREGYGRDGYNAAGYNRQGFDRDGYDKEGYDVNGYDKEGYNRQGCNAEYFDRDGNRCVGDASGNTVSTT